MLKKFMIEEDGMGVVEVVLIIVCLVTIAAIFRRQIISLVNSLWDSINNSVQSFR